MRTLAVLFATAVAVAACAADATADRPRHVASAAADGCGVPDRQLPYWARARRMTVLNDSVLLSGKPQLLSGLPCWRVELVGRPALMLKQATFQLRTRRTRVAPLVVIGLGYNSLWERNRHNYGRWARRFDAEARQLLSILRRAGAEQFIWVTLRHVTASNTPSSHWNELGLYRWYFPYVNERLRNLNRRRDRVVLADWSGEGRSPGVTYDTIHLNQRGGRMMQRLIERTLYEEAQTQAGRVGRGELELAGRRDRKRRGELVLAE